MANVEHLPIDMNVPIDEIESEMSRLLADGGSNDPRLMRLGFIHLRYKGFSVKEASGIVGVSPQMGYRWQRSWNEEGIGPFVSSVRIGRRSRLTPEQKEDVLDRVSGAQMTTAEARDMLAREYGTDYTIKQVHVILSKGGLVHKRAGGGPMVWTRDDDDYPRGLRIVSVRDSGAYAPGLGPITVKFHLPGGCIDRALAAFRSMERSEWMEQSPGRYALSI